MKFNVICKVCGKAISPGSLEEHLKSHEPLNYFDVVPVLTWNEGKK